MVQVEHSDWITAIAIIIPILVIPISCFGLYKLIQGRISKKDGGIQMFNKYRGIGILEGVLSIPLFIGVIFLSAHYQMLAGGICLGTSLGAMTLSIILICVLHDIFKKKRDKQKSVVSTPSNLLELDKAPAQEDPLEIMKQQISDLQQKISEYQQEKEK